MEIRTLICILNSRLLSRFNKNTIPFNISRGIGLENIHHVDRQELKMCIKTVGCSLNVAKPSLEHGNMPMENQPPVKFLQYSHAHWTKCSLYYAPLCALIWPNQQENFIIYLFLFYSARTLWILHCIQRTNFRFRISNQIPKLIKTQ